MTNIMLEEKDIDVLDTLIRDKIRYFQSRLFVDLEDDNIHYESNRMLEYEVKKLKELQEKISNLLK